MTIESPFTKERKDGTSVTGPHVKLEIGVTDFQANRKRRVGTYHIYVIALSNIQEWKLNWQKECDYVMEFIVNALS